MRALFDRKQNRREFLQSSARYLFLGGLATTAGTLVTERKLATAQAGYPDTEICRSCNLLEDCDLPKALLARKQMARW